MKKTYIYVATAIFFWSTVAVISKLLLGSYNNFQVLWVSALFASLFLLIINTVTGNIKKLKAYKPRDYIITILTGLPGTFFYYVFFYAGTDRMPASQAFIVNYLWPVMSIVFACIIMKEKMTVRKLVAVLISFIGVGVVMGGNITDLKGDIITGAGFCILGAVSYGVFTSLGQKYPYDKRISMMINFCVTFIITTVINGVRGEVFIPSGMDTLGFLWNGVLTMAVANTAWNIALESGKTAKISNLAYITPFLSLVWTALILKEQLTVNAIAGLVIIVLGIFIQLKNKE